MSWLLERPSTVTLSAHLVTEAQRVVVRSRAVLKGTRGLALQRLLGGVQEVVGTGQEHVTLAPTDGLHIAPCAPEAIGLADRVERGLLNEVSDMVGAGVRGVLDMQEDYSN